MTASPYRLAVGLAVVGSLVLLWISLGVGVIGADGDPANLAYFGVVAVGLAGAYVARGRAGGMARALIAMAVAQSVVTAVALAAGLGQPYSPPLELVALNGMFVAVFAASAWLFHRAAGGAARLDAA